MKISERSGPNIKHEIMKAKKKPGARRAAWWRLVIKYPCVSRAGQHLLTEQSKLEQVLNCSNFHFSCLPHWCWDKTPVGTFEYSTFMDFLHWYLMERLEPQCEPFSGTIQELESCNLIWSRKLNLSQMKASRSLFSIVYVTNFRVHGVLYTQDTVFELFFDFG